MTPGLADLSPPGECDCDDPHPIRTLSKGTPGDRQYCVCGGVIPE